MVLCDLKKLRDLKNWIDLREKKMLKANAIVKSACFIELEER